MHLPHSSTQASGTSTATTSASLAPHLPSHLDSPARLWPPSFQVFLDMGLPSAALLLWRKVSLLKFPIKAQGRFSPPTPPPMHKSTNDNISSVGEILMLYHSYFLHYFDPVFFQLYLAPPDFSGATRRPGCVDFKPLLLSPPALVNKYILEFRR